MSALPSSRVPRKRFSPWLLPWLVLVAALFGTFIVWSNSRENALQALQTRFEYNTLEASNYIVQRMATYELALRGAQGLFASSDSVERDEFREFISRLRLDKNYPGIQGIGFAMAVTPEQKNQHIASIRRQGFPVYAIHPEGEREAYAPIIYLEPPNERNQRAFGYDMYSDLAHPREGDSAPGLRRAAIEKARDSGETAISGKIRLLAETGEDIQAGIVMCLPVYRKGAPAETVAARRANIAGWIYAPFRMDDLMVNVLAEHGSEINVEIYDGEKISREALLYINDKTRRAGNGRDALFHATRHINIAGRTWTMAITSQPSLDSQLDKEVSLKSAFVGVAVSLMLTLLTWLGVHDRELALTFARQASESRARINRLNEQLAFALKDLERIMNAFPDLHYMVNLEGKLVRWNTSFEKFVGLEHSGLLDRQITDFIYEEDKSRAMDEIQHIAEQDQSSSEIRFIRHDGVSVPFLCNCAVIKSEEGDRKNILVAGRDISDRKAMEDQMEHLAHFDQLTSLPNRALFSDRLQQALATAKRDKMRMALMFIDLDEFKPINDDLGHDIGDQLLQQVAQRLQGCMRESDTAARIGGDEFLVLLPYIEMAQDALVVSEKIRLTLYQPFEVAGETLHISSSIGISIYPEHGLEEKILVKNADIAMYHAKKSGRNNVQLYQPGMQEITG
ncbi:MAG: CHASE domain-containing protein [Gallionellaceae bacterium]|nr:CHASE domain-containing protein [Gallionellaceae bacterium]